MTILVVGGAGYIGSITTEQLLESGHKVVVYDNLATGHRQAVPPAALLVEGDLADTERLEGVFREYPIQAVMHFAGLIVAPESVRDPAAYFANNIAGTISLLNVTVRSGVKRFVFSSSAAVYGEAETIPIPESAPELPSSPYGESKLVVERLLRWYEAALGLRYASLRYFNAAGASVERGEDHCPETHLIPIVLEAALGQRAEVAIYGTDYPTPDGTCIRDYIHVSDLAGAHILALESLEQESGIYNLGNGKGFSVREVIETARRVTGAPIKVVEGPKRPGDPPALVASSERAQVKLGWKPQHSDLATVIESAWEWRCRHPQGYKAGR